MASIQKNTFQNFHKCQFLGNPNIHIYIYIYIYIYIDKSNKCDQTEFSVVTVLTLEVHITPQLRPQTHIAAHIHTLYFLRHT